MEKILCWIVIAFLFVSGAAVMIEPARGQTQPETVTFQTSVDCSSTLRSLAEGDSDIFMYSLSPSIYEDMDQDIKDELGYWKASGGSINYYFNRAWEGPNTTAMQNAVENGWIEEAKRNGPLYEVNNEEGEWEFNPFAVQEVRYAMNHLIDRQSYVEDFLNGFGEPRYSWLARRSAVYQDKFREMIESGDPDPTDGDFGMTPRGDQEWAMNYINDTLMEIANGEADVPFMGQLRPPSEGDSGFWEYTHPSFDEWRIVEVRGVIREEDWRNEMGLHFAEQLENKVNIKVDKKIETRADAIPLVFYGHNTPFDNVSWHFYTGGWLPKDNNYYPHNSLRRMAYGYYTYGEGDAKDGHWHYGMTEEGQKLNNLTQPLVAGHVKTKVEYWRYIKDAVELAVQDSVRVYTTTETNLYTYDKDSINSVVTNPITGWDQVFGPRTLDTDEDHLKVAHFDTGMIPLGYGCNRYGGSKSRLEPNKAKWVLGFQAGSHPKTGKPMEMGSTWNVTTNYSYDENGRLQKKLEIPTSAMEYDPHNETWKTVGEYYDGEVPDVATKATISVKEGKWHDGTEHGLHTIAEYYGRTKNMVYQNDYNNNPDYYYEEYASRVKSWWENVKAIEFHPATGNYTIYGNYTFPSKDMIGKYYTMEPRNSQPVYEAFTQEVVDTDLSTSNESWAWEQGVADNWVHLLSSRQGQIITQTMQKMIEEDFVPAYVKRSQPLSDNLTFSASEYAEKLQAAIDFYKENDNLFISYGPYYISDVYEVFDLKITRFEGYTDYFDWDRWKPQREIDIFDLQVPDEVIIGNDIEVSALANISEGFPTYPIGEDEELDLKEVVLYKEGEPITTITNLTKMVNGKDTRFEASVPTEGLEEGNYKVEMTLSLAGSSREKSVNQSVLLKGYELKVTTQGQGEVEIDPEKKTYEEGEEVTLTVSAEEGWKFKEWTGDVSESSGEKEITITMDGDKEITAVFKEKENKIPGFTSTLVLFITITTVLIHHWKKQRSIS